MAEERRALSTIPLELPAATDYEAIYSAVMATARGRWFLAEYARRNRNNDTSQVLAAIERIESTMVDARAREASQEVRIELLEMARAIAQTRAAVAESHSPPHTATALPSTAAEPDIVGAAGRLRDIAMTMRACGLEPGTSRQIEQIAEAILSASALRDPGDHRARKLAEVLHYLEHRIDRMLDGHRAGTDVAASDSGPTTVEESPRVADRAAPADAKAMESAPAEDAVAQPDQTVAMPAGNDAPSAPGHVLATLLHAMAVAEPAEAHSVAMQVEQDLQALAEALPAAELPDDPPKPASPASGPVEASSEPLPNGGRMAVRNATAEQRPNPRPVPSMWEHARQIASAPLARDEPRYAQPLPALAAMTDEERIALFT